MNYTSDSDLARKKLQKYSYQLNSHIGKGYSSQVFKGRNDLTNQSVAIKVIDMKMIKGQVHKNLLASQIQVLKTLKNSQNIIEVYDIYTTKNNTYIITQLCDGGDLAKAITNKKCLPEYQAIELMNQIICGYNHISNKGIIHRDLKPANIFLRNSQVKIADFGFALKSVDSKKYSSYNVGSPIYMPPEALNDNKYSFKSDIWALGVIFYEMLTGKTPWRAKTQKQLGKQLLSVPISKLLPKNLSASSNEFLIKTLNININQRMGPEELNRFTFSSSENYGSKKQLYSSHSINERQVLSKCNNRIQTSLTKNSISTPKNLTKFNFMKGAEQAKNPNLSKTATSVSMKTEYLISPTNQNVNPDVFNSTQKKLSTNFGSTNKISIIDKKLISKQLLSQIHFCRFLYKLLTRIEQKLSTDLNQQFRKTKQQMCGLIFNRLEDIENLKLLNSIQNSQYKGTSDFQKIIQIVNQYQIKYNKDLQNVRRNFTSYNDLRDDLSYQILQLHRNIQGKPSSEVKEQVIVLDYLITLRQLIYILEQQNLQSFHLKSKMQQIVQGAPSQNITNQHITAITSKLRTLKML